MEFKPLWSKGEINGEIIVFVKEDNLVTAHLTFKNPTNVHIYTRNGYSLEYGKDYTLDGNTVVLHNLDLPYFQSDWLRNENVPSNLPNENALYKIEGCLLVEPYYMRDMQLLADYTYEIQPFFPIFSDNLQLSRTYQKLTKEKKLKIALFGDSISNGANSSWSMKIQGDYTHWFSKCLQQIEKSYGAEISFVNFSRSGYGTDWAKTVVKEKFAEGDIDLAVIAFGMNDGAADMSVKNFTENIRALILAIKEIRKETEFILVATPEPNSLCPSVYKQQKNYIYGLRTLEGNGIAVLDMTKIFAFLASKKAYCEISGNNLNHPNDFGYRFYTDAFTELFLTLKAKNENRLNWSQYLRSAHFESVSIVGLPSNVYAGYLHTVIKQDNHKTFVFIGFPEKVNKKTPAVILAHGAGGNAYVKWVQEWAKRGYIALSVDLNNKHFTNEGLEIPQENKDAGTYRVGSFASVGKDAYKSWTYYAVAQLITAQSYLRELPFVDKEKIGLVGISWGGVVSLLALGVDKRFAAGAIIYSAGFITEDLLGQEKKLYEDWEKKIFYDTYFDPKNYLQGVKIPILFNAGLNDAAFSPFSRQRTYNFLKGKVELAVIPDLYHDNESNFENKNVFAFMDDQFFGTQKRCPLPVTIRERRMKIKVPKGLTSLTYLHTDGIGDPHQIIWKEEKLNITEDDLEVIVDKDEKYAMVVAYYGDGLYTSSDIFNLEKSEIIL